MPRPYTTYSLDTICEYFYPLYEWTQLHPSEARKDQLRGYLHALDLRGRPLWQLPEVVYNEFLEDLYRYQALKEIHSM